MDITLMLVEYTPVYNEEEVSNVIKKAWKPGFRLVGNDNSGYPRGTIELASVLQIEDIVMEMNPIVLQTYIYWGMKLGVIHESKHRGYVVAYSLK